MGHALHPTAWHLDLHRTPHLPGVGSTRVLTPVHVHLCCTHAKPASMQCRVSCADWRCLSAQVFDCHAGRNQRWYIDTQGRIHSSLLPDKCVDVSAGRGVAATCSAASTQRFYQLGEWLLAPTQRQQEQLTNVNWRHLAGLKQRHCCVMGCTHVLGLVSRHAGTAILCIACQEQRVAGDTSTAVY